ncbi:hypothetical protein CC1G_11603 [Coprinopsis cinerea okayama7|uniref:N-acetyltransferase domain-containing protein n=1 Tax=Coprinopsis cinerea (strain Okayama-7 / 130 / ATCC MYA-4618 / FGSC 9003) TaxID=240176 RepID=A8PCP9_COPC7|nr:hypothetical protein CC1G_11603 [Coprinopsis cinerea okayama7\|eukprot:XP_001840446.2 hypothetical protein CC1G_11603 [Coprinopsis cinerea okayama7\
MSLQPTPKHLINPSKEEIDRAADVLAKAFAPDPFTQIVTGGDTSLSYAQLRAGIASAAVGGDLHVLALGPNPDDIIGVAAWFPPGTSINSTPEQRAAGWDEFINNATPTLREWWLNYFIPSMTKFTSTTLGENYTKNAWHLHLFGVLPEYQGKGLGKMLYRFAEEQAKLTKSNIALETSTDVDVIIYQKLGFKVRGEIPIVSEVGKNRMVLMTKGWEDIQ